VLTMRRDAASAALAGAARLLGSLGPEQVLARGYAYVTSGGHVVPTAADARARSGLTLRFGDGSVDVTTTVTTGTPRRTATAATSPTQERLL